MRNFLILVFATGLLFMTTLWLIVYTAPAEIHENPCFYGCPTVVDTGD